MPALIPLTIIYPSSPNPAEILCAFEDETGAPVNITITDPDLGARIASTPRTIPNPAYEALAAQAFEAAEATRVEPA